MDKWKAFSFLMLSSLSVVFAGAAEVRCPSQQYFEMYTVAIINCTIIGEYNGIHWFQPGYADDSPASVSYVDGNRAGHGYKSGVFDITDSGSLIIKNATVADEGLYRVMMLSLSYTSSWKNISVVIYVLPPNSSVHVDDCPRDECRMSISRNGGFLTCSVDNVRPQAHLEWVYTGGQHVQAPIEFAQFNMTIQQTGDLHSSTLTASYDVISEVEGNLSVMCRVTNAAFENRLKGITVILVDSPSLNIEDWSHLERVVLTVILSTLLSILCLYGLVRALWRRRKHKPWRRRTWRMGAKKRNLQQRSNPPNDHTVTVDGSSLIFRTIPGLDQPMDVVTMGEFIVVIMKDYVSKFDWDGKSWGKYVKPGQHLFAAAAESEFIYVTEQKNRRVIKMNRLLNEVNLLGEGHLGEPTGIAISEISGWILVANQTTAIGAVVSIFNKEGEYIKDAAYNELGSPWRMVCDTSRKRLYVTDKDAMQVDIYDINDQLTFKKTISTRLNSKPMRCMGLTLDDDGNIYATLRAPGYRSQMECIAKYDPEGTQMATYWESPPPSPRLKALFSKLPKIGYSIDSIVDDIFLTDKHETLLDFARSVHYCKHDGEEYLLIVDAGNECLRVSPLVEAMKAQKAKCRDQLIHV